MLGVEPRQDGMVEAARSENRSKIESLQRVCDNVAKMIHQSSAFLDVRQEHAFKC